MLGQRSAKGGFFQVGPDRRIDSLPRPIPRVYRVITLSIKRPFSDEQLLWIQVGRQHERVKRSFDQPITEQQGEDEPGRFHFFQAVCRVS